MEINSKKKIINVNLGAGIPFIILLYIIGCGLGWWEFSWSYGFLAVLLDIIF